MSKIPQGEWNAIAARYQNGESISKIARSYGCTPPAIHYILKRNRQRPAEILRKPTISAAAPSLNPARANASDPVVTAALSGNSSAADGPAASLATASAPNSAAAAELRSQRSTTIARPMLVRARAAEAAPNAQSSAPPMREATAAPSVPPSGLRDAGPEPRRPGATSPVVLPGLDDALHLRAEAAIASFRLSFDAALAEASPGVRERLRQAANDLMRVAARTTIVIDRLNATTERSARGHDYPRSAHAGDDFCKLG